MSLHDIDKRSDRRASPSLNANDSVINRMAHATTGFTLKTESDSGVPVLSVKDGRIQVKRADGTLLAQFGFRDLDGDGAVDVAKPGSALT